MATNSEILSNFKILQGVNLHQVSELAQQCAEVSVQEGATIFREGEESRYLIFLLEGTLELKKSGHICDVPPLSLVGEMAAFTDEPRSATLVARSAARYLSLTEETFQRLIEADRDFGFHFYRNLSVTLMNHLKKNNLLVEFYQLME